MTTSPLTELQIRLTYLEDTIDTLNDVVTKQDRAIKDLQDQLKLMYNHLMHRNDDTIATFDLLADRPPHY